MRTKETVYAAFGSALHDVTIENIAGWFRDLRGIRYATVKRLVKREDTVGHRRQVSRRDNGSASRGNRVDPCSLEVDIGVVRVRPQVSHDWRDVVDAVGNVSLEGHGGGIDKTTVQIIAVGQARIVASSGRFPSAT